MSSQISQVLTFEGTKDFLITTPALLVTFLAEESTTPGYAVELRATGRVGTGSANTRNFVGVAYETVASGSKVGVIVWGFVKNVNASVTVNPGDLLQVSGSGKFAPWVTAGNSGSIVGRAYSASGSAGTFQAFINGFGA
jgi:hypothetical protein